MNINQSKKMSFSGFFKFLGFKRSKDFRIKDYNEEPVFYRQLPDERYLVFSRTKTEKPIKEPIFDAFVVELSSKAASVFGRSEVKAMEPFIENVKLPKHITPIRSLFDGTAVDIVKKEIQEEENKPKPLDRKTWVAITLKYLELRGFKPTIDRNLNYRKGARCYYKKLPDGRYLVFYHFCHNKPFHLQCFDPIIVNIKGQPKQEFGDSTVKSKEWLVIDYHPERDRPYIDDLLAGKKVSWTNGKWVYK